MKSMAGIFGFLILFLALVPCTDSFGQHEHGEQTVIVNICDADSSPHEDDHCTPFCSCHCCHVHTVVNHIEVLVAKIIPSTHSTLIPGFQDLLFTQRLLRPPRG